MCVRDWIRLEERDKAISPVIRRHKYAYFPRDGEMKCYKYLIILYEIYKKWKIQWSLRHIYLQFHTGLTLYEKISTPMFINTKTRKWLQKELRNLNMIHFSCLLLSFIPVAIACMNILVDTFGFCLHKHVRTWTCLMRIG